MSLKKQTYIALFWSFIDRAGEQIIRFIFSILLARLLSPSAFGLIGMVYVVTEIARVFVMGGLGLALINKQNVGKKEECTVFYLNIIMGIISVIAIYYLAPLIGSFYKNEEVVPLLRVLSWNLLISSIGAIQTVLMTKKINFKSQTKVSVSSTLISNTIGVVLALNGFGVWALVYQNLTRALIYTVFMWIVYSWRPALKFSFASAHELFMYGSKLLLANLVQIIFNNIYIIIIGKLFSPFQLGYFTRARQTQQLPLDTLWAVIVRVSFPVLSTIKDDTERFCNALQKASNTIAFFVFPSLIIGAFMAPGLFRLLFGEKWIPSVIMFQILCIGSVFLPLEQIRYNAIVAKGNPGIQFILLVTKYATTLLSILISYRYGIRVLLMGFGIVSYANFILSAIIADRMLGYPFVRQITDLFPIIVSTVVAGAITWFISQWLPPYTTLTILLQGVTGSLVYLLLAIILKINVLFDNVQILKKYLSSFRKQKRHEN